MAITLNDQLYSFSPKALDGKYGKQVGADTVPFASVAEANAAIPQPYRHRGLMVTIDTGSGNTLYWYKDGKTDGDLVPFGITDAVTSVDASATGALQFSGGPVTATGTLALAWTGTNAQVVMGDGSFSSFPTTDLSNYYTKTELLTAGQSTVDWANIVNAPVIDIPQSGITGGVVTWISGLTFHVTAADYYIDGVHYTSPATDITLDAADGTNPRLDVLAVTSAGTVVKITGTAGATPAEPQVNYFTQLKLTSILLNAGATTPAGIIENVIYDEGVEWTGTSQGTIAANFLSSAITPFRNSFEVSTDTYSDQSGIMFSNNVPVGINNNKTLNLHLYSTEAFTGSDDIKVQFLKNGVAVSDVRSLPFSKSTVNLWQYVSFLLTDFTFTSLDFNQVKFIFTGTTTTRSVYWDYILLQDGIPQGDTSTPTLQGLQDVINVNNLLDKNNDINIATGKTLSIQSEDGNNYVFVGPANTELYATSNDGNSYTSIYSNPGNGGSSSIFVEAGTNVGRLSTEVNKNYLDVNLYDATSTLLNNFKMDATGFTLKTLEAQTVETKMLYIDDTTGRVKIGNAPASGSTYTVDNALTENVAGNFQLGGTLAHDTQIDNIGYNFIINTTGVQYGLRILGTANGMGLNTDVWAFPLTVRTRNESPILFEVMNDSLGGSAPSIMQLLNNPAGSAANGIGTRLEFGAKTSAVTSRISNQLISKWANITDTSRTSLFELWGVNNAVDTRQLAISGTGQLTLDAYTSSSAFTGTAVANLAVDASGNVLTVAAGGGGSTAPVDITYSSLSSSISGGTLVPGTIYRLTDFQTVHTIYNTTDTNTGPTEVLLLTALTTNELAPVAYSESYPDDVIYYNPTNDTTVMPGCTKGFIYRRIDTKRNNDLPNDFRVVVYRRWAATVTAWNSGTTYAQGDSAESGGKIWISAQNSNTNNTPTGTSDAWWVDSGLIPTDKFLYGDNGFSPSGWTVDAATHTDYPLFNSTAYSNGNVINNRVSYSYNSSSGIPLTDITNNVFTGTTSRCKDNVVDSGSTWRHNVFLNGSKFEGNTVLNYSNVENNFITAGGYIQRNHVSDSRINGNILNGAGIYENTLSSNTDIAGNVSYFGDIDYNTLTNSGDISYNYGNFSCYQNTLDNYASMANNAIFGTAVIGCSGNGAFLNNAVLTHFTAGSRDFKNNHFRSANGNGGQVWTNTETLVYATQLCDIYKRPDGTWKLSYMNNTDTLTVTAITT